MGQSVGRKATLYLTWLLATSVATSLAWTGVTFVTAAVTDHPQQSMSARPSDATSTTVGASHKGGAAPAATAPTAAAAVTTAAPPVSAEITRSTVTAGRPVTGTGTTAPPAVPSGTTPPPSVTAPVAVPPPTAAPSPTTVAPSPTTDVTVVASHPPVSTNPHHGGSNSYDRGGGGSGSTSTGADTGSGQPLMLATSPTATPSAPSAPTTGGRHDGHGSSHPGADPVRAPCSTPPPATPRVVGHDSEGNGS